MTPAQVSPIPAFLDPDPLQGDYCVSVYVEVDYDIVRDKGPAGSRTFAEGLLGEVASLYQAQGITLNYTVKYWDMPSPYAASTSGGMLDQFRVYQNEQGGHPGNVALLLSYQASGGIAYVDVICRANFGVSFASIRNTYLPYPQYSWSVEVIAHELGHNLGSPHTQACVWNGNNTAIDGCYSSEGGCDRGPVPDNGGTVMSYCHLASGVGINFSKGFHPQPLALMKNRIAGAACVACSDDPDDPEPPVCQDNQVIIEMILDNYPAETSWEVYNEGGAVVGASLPWTKLQMNSYQADTICLPDGCYNFVIKDVDGLAGYGCSEGFYNVASASGDLASGQDFTGSESTTFCFGTTPPPGDCDQFPTNPVVSFWLQDQFGTESHNEGTITLIGNTWKAIEQEYTLTPNTWLRAEVRINETGEIHGFMLVDVLTRLTPSNVLRFGGTQAWGMLVDNATEGEWKQVNIPVGQYLPNITYSYMVLINDEDNSFADASTSWRNIEMCEGAATTQATILARPQVQGTVSEEWNGDLISIGSKEQGIAPYPNPVSDTLNLTDLQVWQLFSMDGKLVGAGKDSQVNMAEYAPGAYILITAEGVHKIIKK
jgi:hypothetical protein